jgi:glycosyltransferase involved in cell wall biosynthesis
MNIFLVFGWGIRIGGHFKSALAHMKCLKVMGHHTSVMMPGGESAEEMVQEFIESGVEIHLFQRSPRRGRFPSYRGTSDILKLCKSKKIDIIHAQDFFSFPACYLAALKLGKGIVFTKPGGPVNNLFPPRSIDAVFYSEELHEGMAAQYHLDPNNISLIRARIDTDIYKVQHVDAEFMERYNLPQEGKKIVMATRLEDSKKSWVDNLLDFAELIAAGNEKAHIVIAGEGPLFDVIKNRAASINKNYSTEPIVHVIGPVFRMRELNQLYNYADIVAGNGRGILEAMACGKPVVIIGESGEGEAVCFENIDQVAFYNFSGRHLRNCTINPGSLKNVLKKLIDEADTCKRLGEFSFQYIKNYMDAKVGAKQLIKVYERCLEKRLLTMDFIIWNTHILSTIIHLAVKRRLRYLNV